VSAAFAPGAAVNRQAAALWEMLRAVNAGEAAAYALVYAEDAVITIHGTGILSGRGAIESYEASLLREFPGARLAFYDFWQDGLAVVVHYGVNGRTPGGQAMGHEGLLFYRFDPSGLVKEERRYLDSATPMAQLGLLGPSPARPLPTLPGPMPGAMQAHIKGTSPREEANAALVRTTVAALDAPDEAAFLGAFAEDGVLDDLSEPSPSAGRPNVKAWFDRWTRAVAGARTEIVTLAAIGEEVLVETIVRGRLTRPLGRLTPSDRTFAVHRAAIVQVKDGKITHLTVFMHSKELAQAVGQWPPPAAK
jgi:ketosteroid isomerase-like protein